MENLNKYVEHTLLKQDAKKADLIRTFEEAKEHNFLGVCINPCYVKLAKENLKDSDVKVVTVIGFPLGANTTETKIFETINKNSEHCCQPTIHIDINAQLVELDSKYKNADEYYNETNDYGADIVEQNGKLYKW